MYTNITKINHFFITGFPELLPEYHGPVSTLLFLLYLVIAVGNIFILVFVTCEKSLHKPSYLIFCHLSLTDLMFGTVTLPKILSKYWFNDSVISFYGCFAQMYFVHFLGAAHSFILMVMALDRFIAICAPLRYTSLFTNAAASVLCGVAWLLPASWMLFVVLDALSLPFCNSNIIAQCYCDQISIINLGCENVRQSTVLGFIGAMVSLLFPLSFIILSYFVIIVAVLRISSSEGRLRTLSTCTPQLLITGLVSQCYCDHASVTKLACGENVAFVQEVAFANAMVTLLFPLSFIIFSYFSIIIAVLKMSNTEGYRKVLSTCAPQILTTCLYYVPRCVVYITDNLKVKVSPDARIIIALLYSLIPAAVNPLIYCLKTADIKAALIKRFKSRKINMALKSNTKQGHKY
uniref:G-protein coupled receptors family 1 profile domain-containing protein n=1 Tax=Oryzias melastigma TaxID=30732 RepID=A0A3B3CZY7_ORYME